MGTPLSNSDMFRITSKQMQAALNKRHKVSQHTSTVLEGYRL